MNKLLAILGLGLAVAISAQETGPQSSPEQGRGPQRRAQPARRAPGAVGAPQRLGPPRDPARTAIDALRPRLFKGHVRFLSSDLLEGRGPATRGDALAREYVAAQMERIGLSPGAPDGTFFQFLDVVGVSSHPPATVRFESKSSSLALKTHEELVVSAGSPREHSKLESADLVFVGYGILAPEYGWDDYKGADLEGKVLVMLNNDPEDDPALFGGKARLWYGRWDYKFEMAARQGAAGALIVHTTPSAGYGWQVVQTSWGGEEFSLPEESEPSLEVKAWATEDAAKRLFHLGGKDLDSLRAAAQKRSFKPVALGVKVSVAFDNTVAKKRTANVIGKLPGSDPVLSAQALVYGAHLDHLGMKADAAPGEDAIFNGALDNSAGVASMLAIAEVHQFLSRRPRRTVYFAALAGEEQGLLGSRYLAAHPPVHPGRIAANINIDGASIWGPTSDVILVGKGKSSLDALVESFAKLQKRTVSGDQSPEKGFFYRSDQFSFARIGVPAVYLDAGLQLVGQPEGEGKKRQEAFEAEHYHQPSDELRDDWNWEGFVEDARLLLRVGLKVANDDEMPTWNQGDEFEAARLKALEEAAKLPPPEAPAAEAPHQ